MLKQLYGRKSERRIDGAGQLLLDIDEEATPEVVSSLEEAIREGEQIVQDVENDKKQRRGKRPPRGDHKFPEHLPRDENVTDLIAEQREGLKFIGYDEVETLQFIPPELRVLLTKYAKYFYPIPFYCQQDMFAGSGWTPSRSTLANIETAIEFAPASVCDVSAKLSQDRPLRRL